jgi:hypothetical protein
MVTKKKYKPDTVRAAFSEWAVGAEHDGEQRMFCPVCENPKTSKTPSASMHADDGVWNCLKEAHGGQIYDLVQDLTLNGDFNLRQKAMAGKHRLNPNFTKDQLSQMGAAKSGPPLPDADKIQGWRDALMHNKPRLKALREQRGFTLESIEEFEIGLDNDRYTFPVRDLSGDLINVRKYSMGAAPANKMLNIPGHGSAALFRPDILRDNDDIVITEGETDCILLNQEGIAAVTHTAGAATFRTNWASQFVDKNVWIAYDADEAGRKGSKKVFDILRAHARNVYIIQMPETTKGADVTDFLWKEGHSALEFQELMDVARGMSSDDLPALPSREAETSGVKTSLANSTLQSNQDKVMEMVVSVAGRQQEPYTAPKQISVNCDMSKGKACELCPISAANGSKEFVFPANTSDLFRFVDAPEQRRKALLKEITGARCSDRVEFDVQENYHIEEMLVQPSVDDRVDGESQQPVKRTAFAFGSGSTEVNRKIRIVGKNVHDPKTGKLRFMSWVADPVTMDIDHFQLTPEMMEALKIFQASDTQTSLEKSVEIAHDMALNVTHIYGRDLLHVGYDLVYHSPIAFKINDRNIDKGWLEMGVIGDTRTGKSEIGARLISHYRAGILQSCEGMSFAGLVGGVQQIDGRWHMSWGVIPMNDRRLVVLDEVSGLKESGVVEQMSSIRSSGLAQITKIATEETSARTRLVWLMNPMDGSSLGDNALGGMGAMRTVIPNAEDVARFDFFMATAKDDVQASVINSGFNEHHSPTYTSELSEALVKWAWSLTRENVIVSRQAAQTASDMATELGGRYVSDPPLIQAENVRFKLLRIAAALAARTFSADEKGRLRVNREHVIDAVTFLDTIYEEDAMGYARASRKSKQADEVAKKKRSVALAYLKDNEDDVLLTLRTVGGSTFRMRDFEEYGAMDRTTAKTAVNQLVKWGLVKMKSRGDMVMDRVLLNIIRELEDEEDNL